ncbi:hypothetical protein FOA43_003763 [Brettanomyces nanus]|uniref:Pre-mRNA-splicing factor SYF1 n=1 Tax=Eeniella nana TaxID=13502 RepID=A0A875S7Z0_EENNA|nr:uncharacterized protein FOA43_003763 [Brettanomyces nanus]QPG76375.1 hypothetical protein FOA43_003763 [Brettanomyces nanus]
MSILRYIDDGDLPYEQKLLKDPYNQDLWLDYIHFKRKGSVQTVLALLNRSVRKLSSSYKIWMLYINFRISLLDQGHQSLDETDKVIAIFERASLYLNKFPFFWVKYLQFVILQYSYINVSFARLCFDRAIQQLPVVHHEKIWKLFLQFVDIIGGPTLFLVNLRYCEFKMTVQDFNFAPFAGEETNQIEDKTLEAALDTIIDTVSTAKELDLLNQTFSKIVCVPSLLTKFTKSEMELYSDYFDALISLVPAFMSDNNGNLQRLDSQVLIFHDNMNSKFPDQMGKWIVKLAQYWRERKSYLQLISTFERGLATCMTLKDFSIIYESYTEFEDSRIELISRELDQIEGTSANQEDELNLKLNGCLQRYERLLSKRPFLINDVKMRRNPNDVKSWADRVLIYDPEGDQTAISLCYEKALMTIEPAKVKEPDLLAQLWIDYIDHEDKNNTGFKYRSLFSTATKVPFKFVGDLEKVWSAWVDKEVEHGDMKHALAIIKQAVTLPKKIAMKYTENEIRYNDEKLSTQVRAHKSIKLWSLYLDIVQKDGAIIDVLKVYDEILRLKLASPSTILNYCSFLEEHKYFERCFKIYERGVSLFKYPTVTEIWNSYLTKIVQYQQQLGIKSERIRDLFEQALQNCPPEYKKALYIMYAEFEETSGLKLQSLRILSEAIIKINNNLDKLELYKLLIAKTTTLKGPDSTSSVYQMALENLPVNIPGFIEDIVCGFVNIEAQQERFKRCRQILHYSSELVMKYSKRQADRDQIWDVFKKFELEYGNELNYKAMLRFKRHLESSSLPIIKDNIDGGLTDGIDFIHSSEQREQKASEDEPRNADQIELDLDDLA